MASIGQRVSSTAWWPGAAIFGIALVVAIHVQTSLWSGGLAPLAVAAVVAAFLGVPVATNEWRLGPETRPAFTWPLGETLLLAAVGAVVGAALAGTGLAGLAAMLIGWPIMAFATRRFGFWPGFVAVGVAMLAMVVSVGISLPGFDGWTLLEPHWETWRDWLPWSLVAGLLLPCAGLGRWAEAPPALPGHRRVPWAVAGLGLLVATAISLAAAVVAEGQEAISYGVVPILLLALCATALAGPPDGFRRRLGIPLVASLWFAGPGFGGLELFWQFLLPLGMSMTIGALAMRLEGQASWTAWVAAAAALGAALFGWPGVPIGTLDAAAAAATLVGLVWIVGTRAVLARQTA